MSERLNVSEHWEAGGKKFFFFIFLDFSAGFICHKKYLK